MKNINIYIKNHNDYIKMTIDSNDKIKQIKKELLKIKGFMIKKQKIFFNHHELEDEIKIKNYKITEIDILVCTIMD